MYLYSALLMQETLETRVEEQERRLKHYQEKIEQILEEKDQIQVTEGYNFTLFSLNFSCRYLIV